MRQGWELSDEENITLNPKFTFLLSQKFTFYYSCFHSVFLQRTSGWLTKVPFLYLHNNPVGKVNLTELMKCECVVPHGDLLIDFGGGKRYQDSINLWQPFTVFKERERWLPLSASK